MTSNWIRENGTLDCPHVGRCGGCPWGNKSLTEVREGQRIEALRSLVTDFEVAPTPATEVRDRVDLIWERDAISTEMRLGLYGLTGERHVVDVKDCRMMSPALAAWFREFRGRAPAINRGSVRLRVSPSGQRGVWLDFANDDVKNLFAEKSYLEWLSARAVVEIGQRRKVLVWRDGLPKLSDPSLQPWFETYDHEGRAIPLFGPIGGFSQAGFALNRALVSAVADLAEQSGLRSWMELFAGNGNLALALASRGHKVEAVELDGLAVQGLEKSLAACAADWVGNVTARKADVYLKAGQLPPLAGRGLIVDPPRAGLREWLEVLKHGERPPAILYVSCFTEVFVTDAAQLIELGYTLKKIGSVDQFPYTPHSEWVALFKRAP